MIGSRVRYDALARVAAYLHFDLPTRKGAQTSVYTRKLLIMRPRSKLQMKTGKLAKSYRVTSGKDFRLKDFDPADTGHWHSKEHAEEALREGNVRLADMQDKLYAQDRWTVLLIF